MSVRLQQKSGADLRKLQLVDIASDLIVSEGVDALKHSKLAELAGCTRGLVYRYVPKKSDIYVAISEHFYNELDRRISVDEQQNIIGQGSFGSAASERFFGLLFEVMEQRGLAALVLNNTPSLNVELETYSSRIKSQYEKRWIDAFRARGLEGVHAELAMANCNSVMTNCFAFYSQGKVDRNTALKQVERAVYKLVENTGAKTATSGTDDEQ